MYPELDGNDFPDELDAAAFNKLVLGKKGKGSRSKGSAAKAKDKTDWVQVLIDQIRAADLPSPHREYQFHAERKWRFDLAWKKTAGKLIAVEVDGGLFSRPVVCHHCHQQVKRRLANGRWIGVREGGGHTTGKGRQKDMEKLNEAQLYGWRVFNFTPDQIRDGEAIEFLTRVFL